MKSDIFYIFSSIAAVKGDNNLSSIVEWTTKKPNRSKNTQRPEPTQRAKTTQRPKPTRRPGNSNRQENITQITTAEPDSRIVVKLIENQQKKLTEMIEAYINELSVDTSLVNHQIEQQLASHIKKLRLSLEKQLMQNLKSKFPGQSVSWYKNQVQVLMWPSVSELMVKVKKKGTTGKNGKMTKIYPKNI